MSEALIFASTKPQYDDRLFIELQVQYMKIPSSNLGRTCCVLKLFLTFRTIFVHNMFSPCSTKRRASDKDLPVQFTITEKEIPINVREHCENTAVDDGYLLTQVLSSWSYVLKSDSPFSIKYVQICKKSGQKWLVVPKWFRNFSLFNISRLFWKHLC